MKYMIKNASITILGKPILNNINIDITDKSHIGIVGVNGAGKTTLLKSLIDNEMLDEGIEDVPFEINKIGNFSIGYLEQITFKDEEITLIEEIKKSFQKFIDMEKRMDELLILMSNDNSNKLIEEYTNLLDQYEIMGGYSYKKNYEVMLNKFGFKESDKTRLLSSFSGGEKTKLAFIKLLLREDDLLLLDEPTNHLDIDAIMWLEDYLKNYKKAFVIVSHDRMFLNNVVNTIYDISYGNVVKYVGNYESYEKQKKENYEQQLKSYERKQQEIARLRSLYERFRYKPSKAAMAMSKLHMIEKMEKIQKPQKIKEKTFKMNLNKMIKSSKVVLTCHEVSVGFNSELARINLELNSGEKLAIIGANGSGKSTILKTIRGIIKPLGGTISFGFNVKLGYFDQNLDMINDNNTVLEEFKAMYPDILENEARSALGTFLFSGEDVNKKVSDLSGGERVRLQLCKILYDKPNFLILDEPTNHLDIVGKQQLENILEDYKGAILFVSHDRYFIKKIATRLLVFEDKEIKLYNCNYDDYISKKSDVKIIPEKQIKKVKEKGKDNSINYNKLKKELKKLEWEIKALEEEKNKLNQDLLNPDFYKDYIKMNEIKDNLKNIEERINSKETKWENLAEKIEDIG